MAAIHKEISYFSTSEITGYDCCKSFYEYVEIIIYLYNITLFLNDFSLCWGGMMWVREVLGNLAKHEFTGVHILYAMSAAIILFREWSILL